MLKFGSKHDSNIVYKCTVRLLEDTEILECEYKPQHKGIYLLEYVCQQLNLIEQDYLGLRYVDNQDQRHWLDLGKSICKQVKDLDPVLFSFRVKFYPPDPFRLKEEITRYQIFLQLKRDLLHGRLYCGPTEAAMLSALILQGEFGDYDPEIHLANYVSDLKILLKQTEAIEEKAMEIHQKQLKGQSQSQVETAFLKLACQLDTYGVDPHPVKGLLQDQKRSQLYLGINYSGILTFQGSRKTHHFRWPDIQKINYEGKVFIIHLNYNDKKHTVGFKCPSGQACRHVWRCAVEQMLFFTLPTSSDAPSVVTGGGFFSWGTKFKYTGRTEKEILEDSGSPSREEPNIQRSSSVRRKASSVPATPSTPLQPHLGYCSLPRSSHSDVGGSRMESSNSTGLLSGLDNNPSQIYSDVAALETVTEDQEAIGATKLRTTVLKDDSMDRFSDYYFRDSFEHSSSESQLVDNYRGYETTNPSHRSSRSPTPLSHSHVDSGRIYLPGAAQSIPPPVKKPKKFNILGAFIPSLVIVLVLALISTIIVLESDWEFFNSVRNVPEIMSLKYQVYEPIKQYWRSKINLLF
ncbi:FERM domain-containing protein 5 isoform X1 [Diabrotica virgifera virgifera]|uniref:Moesin/ezrin/radixin homolog 1 n=2 Tax=Diabrotica virgifera virgifera TaxID=50390 RepID=A0ABM5JHK1_DIAVI|nr:FERM domain-containing protein 5 isoform X1 [Diabrotica virgifera virgifera]